MSEISIHLSGLSLGLGAAGAGAVAFAAMSCVSIAPANTFWGPLIARGPSDGIPGYALTFDDGPTPGWTPAVLDILGELGVRGAFFVIGQNARQCPDLLARIHAEGHIIANHSLDHERLSMFRGQRYWDRQLRETDDIIGQIIGLRPALFRPPMGVKTYYIMAAARRRGQAVITWSRRAMDGITTTSQRILDRLVPHTEAGDVLLLHDGVNPHIRHDPTPTVDAIKPLILRLRDRGLQPARLDEFLSIQAYAPAGS